MSPCLGAVDLIDAVEDRGLAGAVGTDDRKQLSAVDMKRDPVDGADSLEGQMDVPDLEQGRVSARPPDS